MYTMVLMMAVTSGGEVSGFGHRNKGCNGGDNAGCNGAVYAAPTGCSGSYAPSSYAPVGYADTTGCNGGGSCHGAKKGFLGGLFGHHRKNSGGSCHGTAYNGSAYNGGSCHGGLVAAPDCGGCPPVVYGTAPVTGGTTPPVIMPKVEDPKPKPKFEDPKPKTDPKEKTESN